MTEAPVPPPWLRDRVGKVASLPQEVLDFLPHLADPEGSFDRLGADIKSQILAALPEEWTFEGKRVLDFGCGCGRVLRHFVDQAEEAEFWGCDIDAPSIAWLRGELCPPFNVLTNGEQPPVDLDDGRFDLIYAISVFTHLTDDWAPWLLEMRRLLKPGGLLLASTHGAGIAFRYDQVAWHEPWNEDLIGMHVTGYGLPWNEGGPAVTHSQWWLRGHWGRALEVIEIVPGPRGGHDFVLARRDRRPAPSRRAVGAPDRGRAA